MRTDPLTFACIPDVHGNVSGLRDVLEFGLEEEPDALLAVGDFGPRLARVRRVLESVGKPVFTVPGNHDPPDTRVGRSIDGRLVEFHGVRMYGVGGAGPASLGLPYEWTDGALTRRDFPRWDLLLSHAPPRNCRLDRTGGRKHVGSAVLRQQVERGAGIFVCGHIHEGVGAEVIGRCLCYNAGSLGGPYSALQLGRIERRSDGEPWTWRVEHYERRSHRWEEVFSLELRDGRREL